MQVDDTLILVLGMHRSGTSVITKALEVFGVSLGDRLMPSGADNPKGFFEDIDLQSTNEAFLRSQGYTWDSLQFPSLENTSESDRISYQNSIYEQLLLRNNPEIIRAFKDPRMCRLWPFWVQPLREAGITVRILWVLRDPFAVAESLGKRNQFPTEMALILWRLHNLGILGALNQWPGISVCYEDLIADPRRTIDSMARGLNIFIESAQSVEQFIDYFLDTNLNHAGPVIPEMDEGVASFYLSAVNMLTDFHLTIAEKHTRLDQAPPSELRFLLNIMRAQQDARTARRELLILQAHQDTLLAFNEDLKNNLERKEQELIDIKSYLAEQQK